MSLYDDDDEVELQSMASPALGGTGWSKGATWMQTQQKTAALAMAPKKGGGDSRPAQNAASKAPSLPPVINLQKNSGKKTVTEAVVLDTAPKFIYGGDKIRGDKSLLPLTDPNWTVVNEYDPLWPNDYHKVVKEIRDAKRDDSPPESTKRRRYAETAKEGRRERYDNSSSSGFGRRPHMDDYSDEEEDNDSSRGARRGREREQRHQRRDRGSSSASGSSGAAIAPPPSLTEPSEDPGKRPSSPTDNGSMVQRLANTPASGVGGGLAVAAKIMAKYGYKHGQGLGAQEQGMSSALSVEKTSKRGGRIVHEKDLLPPPPPPPPVFAAPAPVAASREGAETPPSLEGGEYGDAAEEAQQQQQQKPSITDLMRNPSKVVLCKNMVGPGEVDDELEPEVKEECNSKYGDVNKVVIFELQNVAAEEAVRIFIEFKRVESAIKAVVDLNGRFFGGREVAASFYDFDKFNNLQLTG